MKKEFFKIVVVTSFCILLMAYVFSSNGIGQTINIFSQSEQQASSVGQHEPEHRFTLKGSGLNKLKEPLNVIVNRDGNIIVADIGDGCVKIFDKDGRFLTKITGKNEKEKFSYPYGLATTAKGDLLISDSENNTVQQFNISGKFIQEIISKDQNIRPGVMLRIDSMVYIADLDNHKILVYDESGKQVSQILANFSFPHGMALDNQNNLWVGDAGRIPSLKTLLLEGVLQNQYYLVGDEANITALRGLAIDSKNRIYVTDAMANKVSIFSNEGEMIQKFGGTGSGDSQFYFPTGIYIDETDKIYIADRRNKRIQVFSY